jgi:chaperone required for assembly of F1-ATPase
VQFGAVVDLLAAYGASDLLCYRATDPEGLITRQAEAWDPLLDWAAQELQAPLRVTQGIVHVDQPEDSLLRLHALTAGFDAFQLAAFHDLVAISGSLVLAFAVMRGRLSVNEAFALSRIDETWQAEQWGVDEDAALLEASKKRAMQEAARFHGLCG